MWREANFQNNPFREDSVDSGSKEKIQVTNVRSEIIAQFTEVASRQGRQLAPLTDDLELLDSGIDSLCFAIIVSRLEETLGVDPFSASEDAVLPVTFGELVRFYENAAQ
jgi:acyl carrier protein